MFYTNMKLVNLNVIELNKITEPNKKKNNGKYKFSNN